MFQSVVNVDGLDGEPLGNNVKDVFATIPLFGRCVILADGTARDSDKEEGKEAGSAKQVPPSGGPGRPRPWRWKRHRDLRIRKPAGAAARV